MYLLDTNVLSELRQGRPNPDRAVLAWAATVPAGQQYLSAIVVLELEKGVQALERRTPSQGSALRVWLDRVRASFAGRILPFTEAGAVLCAGLHRDRPRPERDAMIAAAALEHQMTVVTRNTDDFAGTGVRILNPWQAAA